MPKKSNWQKYLTREYSFLYISYAADCYHRMKKMTGATINFDLAHGEGDLVSLYGVVDDFENCYQSIDTKLRGKPKHGLEMIKKFDNLSEKYFQLVRAVGREKERNALKEALLELDKVFLDLLCYYLYFVYLGYGGDKPAIKKFLRINKKKFEEIRNSGVETHMDKKFPDFFGKYGPKMKNLISRMSRAELLKLLSGKKLDPERIKKRKKEYLMITRNGKTKEYQPKEIKKSLARELENMEIVSKDKFVKGKTASKGKAKGPARIVFAKKDYGKIKKGDILVTPMTKPDIVSFLSRVKGIITNDGGALSHASIISREMKIPCIVGTIHATDIFKDGDKIELNADKGMAKILQ